MRRDATISDDGRYRYRLERTWGIAGRTATWVMLNPSTADGHIDDPTLRRVVGLTRRDPLYGRVIVVNLFAYRSPRPKALLLTADPIGPDNDQYIAAAVRAASRTAGIVVAAWGAGARFAPDRVAEVERMLPTSTVCLGLTQSGHPRHPLYVRATAPLIYYRGDSS